MSMRRAILLILIAALAMAGCSSTKVYRLTEERFPATKNPDDVRLFLGQVQRPHIRIAYVNSYLDREKTVLTKRDQLQDLRRRAAKLGAEAVVNVQLLREKHEGFEMDPTVPFSALRQGQYNLYFLRGTAIRYVSEEEAQAAEAAEYPESTFNIDTIPEVDTEDAPLPDPPPNEGY
ncbi:hypothetical protein KQI84_04425 [bacterium]|nr:hypothetical protein [bacterium]